MPDALIAKAELIADWLDAALHTLREHPRGFADLLPDPLEQARFFLRERLLPEVRGGLRLPLTALICGGTNTGKSTIFNALTGKALSPSGGIASLTKRLIASATEDSLIRLVQSRKNWHILPIDTRQEAASPDSTIYATGQNPGDHLPLLIDSPDIDSSDPTCHRLTRRGLAFADLLVWVTTQQKYRDEAGIAFLDEALRLTATRIDVFNQALSRHQDALEDLHRTYDARWPELERYRYRVDEDRSLSQNGVLNSEQVEPLRARLQEFARTPLALKRRSLSHGVACQCKTVRERAGQILQRQEEWNKERQEVARQLEKRLFSPLRHLRGHDNPLELQAAIIRVIGPKMQTVIGDAVNQGLGAIGRTIGRLRGLIFGSSTVAAAEPIDVKNTRDQDDLREAREIMETARSDLLERARRKAERGHPMFARLRLSLQKIAFPQGADLEKTLRAYVERESQQRLTTIVTSFEADLESFCRRNPEFISVLRVGVPGLAALAGFAAAVVGVHAFAMLPGITEYLLGGIAIPIFQALERTLPQRVLELIDRLSREPFLTQTRDRFIQTRREIFAETGRLIAEPITGLFDGPEIKPLDIHTQLDHLQQLWQSYSQEVVKTP